MNLYVEKPPFVALVDDDRHSAQLLTRMMLAHGAPAVQWYGGATDGITVLNMVLAAGPAQWPSMVVADLKSHSTASLDFIKAINSLIEQKSLVVAVMIAADDRAQRGELLEAGAAAVFYRHADLDAYRAEAASLVSFWARNQRLEAVGM